MKRLLFGFFAFVLAAPLYAQQQPNTSELRIILVDETNSGIPAATITVTPATGEPITFMTDERGRGISPALPPGQVTVAIDYPGFEPYKAPVTLRRGAVNQTITLKIAGLSEEVVVSNESAEDKLRAATATTTLSQEELESLPDDEEELRTFLEELAGPGGATFFMNGFRGGRLPSRDEIRAIRIRQNSFGADGHDAGRASIEIVTRPSTQFAGNLNLGFKGDQWNARNALARVETPEGEKNAQFSVRGPLVPGKTSLRFNGTGNNAFQSNAIIALDETTGVPLGAQARSSSERRGFTTALEHSLTNNQSLFLEFQHSNNESSNGGGGGFNLPERASFSEGSTNQVRTRVQGLIGRTTLHEIRLDFYRQQNESHSLTEGPAIVVQDAFSRGGAGVENRRLTQTFELADNVDFTIGRKHQMRVGMLLEGGLYDTFDESNKHGRWTYATLEDYRANRPLQFSQRVGTIDTSFQHYQLGFYVQDDIRVNGRLSVGVGLRNEMQSRVGDKLNLMPRIGFTLNPGGNRTAIRGGYGVFYDWYEANFHDQTLRLNGVSQRDITVNYLDGRVSESLTGRTIASPAIKMPQQHQASIGVEHQLRQNMQMGVSYQMLRGRNVIRARDINTPQIAGVDAFGNTVLLRPNPELGIVTQLESTGRSESDRITAQYRISLPQRRMNFNVNYTFGFANATTTGTQLPSNSLNPDLDWGPQGQDIRHQLQGQAQSPLPYGFRFNMQWRVVSGPAYNWTTGMDNNRDGVINDRPAGVTRNALRGDGNWNIQQLRVSKSVGFGGPRGGATGGGQATAAPQAQGRQAANQQIGNGVLAQRGQGGGGGGGRGPAGGGNFDNQRYNVEFFINASNPLNRVIPQGYSGNERSPYFLRTTSVQQARRVDLGMSIRF